MLNIPPEHLNQNKMEQSAVEWIVEQYEQKIGKGISSVMADEIKQAKEIDKEQRIKIPPYNLDELALIKYPIHNVSYEGFTIDNNALKRIGFIDGFKEALELLTFKSE
jgi:hypothetical protein